jgi:hypothetical protein
MSKRSDLPSPTIVKLPAPYTKRERYSFEFGGRRLCHNWDHTHKTLKESTECRRMEDAPRWDRFWQSDRAPKLK